MSKVDIERVTVFFPGESVLFEKIAAESTTEYFEFAQGVYAYAAYEVTSGSQKFVQPVADWMGESPMAGNDFTYTIDFDPSRDQYDWIRVLQVVRDR